MSGLFIVRVKVIDPERYGQYQALVTDVVAEFGGEFLTRGGEVGTLEGPEETRRVVVVKFPSAERVREFYASPGYQEAFEKRIGAAEFEGIVVEGK
jgi:uncharacterized protein (DUF1330 family)